MKLTRIFMLCLYATASVSDRICAKGSEEVNSEKICTVQDEELEIFASYLSQGSASPQIVVSETEATPPDINSLNVRLAPQGRKITSDIQTDFEDRNRTACTIRPFLGISNLHFISRREYERIFGAGWRQFYEKYGRTAEIVWLSRVGFNADKTMALVHVSFGADKVAGGGALYLFQRRGRSWSMKAYIQTWAT